MLSDLDESVFQSVLDGIVGSCSTASATLDAELTCATSAWPSFAPENGWKMVPGDPDDGKRDVYVGVDYDESVFQSVLDGIVGSCSTPVSDLPVSDLPDCYCDNFRNSLTTDNLGEMACARSEVHGLTGYKNWCAMPSRPYIPLVDSGCPYDMFRCIVTHTPPDFPPCDCDTYANGASPTSTDGLCQKIGTSKCSPRSYMGDKKIGGSEYYGCPEDMFRCTAAPAP